MKTLLVDDHALFRAGLRLLIQTISPEAEILEAGTIGEALAIAGEHADLQLCLLDLTLRDEDGLDALSKIKAIVPNVAVVVISAAEEPTTIYACIEAGAMSFIPKSAPPETLTDALSQVLAGAIYLPAQISGDASVSLRDKPTFSPRQLEVMRGLSRGLPTKLIARELGLSEYTVREYIAIIYRILDVHSRTEAVIKVNRMRLRFDLT
jgi:DNA-binding NarL/FixJ family response regulator